jgi:hypothetical protein
VRLAKSQLDRSYSPKFHAENMTLDHLVRCTPAELRMIGVPLGDAFEIMQVCGAAPRRTAPIRAREAIPFVILCEGDQSGPAERPARAAQGAALCAYIHPCLHVSARALVAVRLQQTLRKCAVRPAHSRERC